jgi:ATPase subunit of ABC transporter with duplicated ATPase domains
LDEYQGAMIIVSHDEEFIEDIHVSEVVKIGK